MKTRRSGIIAGLIVVGVILVISFLVLGPDEGVEVIQPQVRDVTELLVTSGQLQVRPSSNLSMSASAVIEATSPASPRGSARRSLLWPFPIEPSGPRSFRSAPRSIHSEGSWLCAFAPWSLWRRRSFQK